MNKSVKLCIAGSREGFVLTDVERGYLAFCTAFQTQASFIVTGGARGVDTLGHTLAVDMGVPNKVVPAEWDKHGKSAGMLRNALMIDECEALLAFWDGQSRGTAHTIGLAKTKGIPCLVVVKPRKDCNESTEDSGLPVY